MLFDKIFYINLDRRPDRNANVKKIIRELNIDAIRVPAVDGSTLDLNTLPPDIITENGIQDAKNKNQKVYVPLTPGGIGCALSHRSVWKKIVDENISSALILEDDIRIDPMFHQKLINFAKYWPTNYDVLFLGYHPSTIKYIDYLNPVNCMFVRTNKVYGLFGYVVSNRGAGKLLKIFPISQQIDTEMYKNFHSLDAYLIEPRNRIIFSDPSEYAVEFGTDIQKRENFPIDDRNEFMYNILFAVVVLVVVLVMVLLYYQYNNC